MTKTNSMGYLLNLSGLFKFQGKRDFLVKFTTWSERFYVKKVISKNSNNGFFSSILTVKKTEEVQGK